MSKPKNVITAAIDLAAIPEHRLLALHLLNAILRPTERVALTMVHKRGSVCRVENINVEITASYRALQDMELITPNPKPTAREQFCITPLGLGVLECKTVDFAKQRTWLRDIREAQNEI